MIVRQFGNPRSLQFPGEANRLSVRQFLSPSGSTMSDSLCFLPVLVSGYLPMLTPGQWTKKPCASEALSSQLQESIRQLAS